MFVFFYHVVWPNHSGKCLGIQKILIFWQKLAQSDCRFNSYGIFLAFLGRFFKNLIEKKQNHILILHTKPHWKTPGLDNHWNSPPPNITVFVFVGILHLILGCLKPNKIQFTIIKTNYYNRLILLISAPPPLGRTHITQATLGIPRLFRLKHTLKYSFEFEFFSCCQESHTGFGPKFDRFVNC